MAEAEQSTDVPGDLYALVAYLHASCNRDLLDAIAREQLSFSQLQLLERLRGAWRSPTIGQAAALMHVSRAGASRIVDGLARRGMVQRQADEADYRAKRIRITERGEEAIKRLHAPRRAAIEAFVESLAPGAREQLQAALRLVLQREQVSTYRAAA
jgi:DNA-binding MarR family transcriptional regulator